MPSSKKVPASISSAIRSREVRRPLPCWFSMALAPPPSEIFSPSFRTCDIRSARKRMLASNRAEVGSTFVVKTLTVSDELSVEGSLRSAMGMDMGQEIGLFTVYHSRRDAQRKAMRDVSSDDFQAKTSGRS